jgi:integrase
MSKRSLKKRVEGRLYELKQHENGTWYVYYSIKGRSKRTSARTKNLDAAAEFFKEFVFLERNPEVVEQLSQEMNCQTIWDARYGNREPNTTTDRLNQAWKTLSPTFGHLHPSEVNKAMVDDYIERRGTGEITGKEAQPCTVRFELASLYATWNQAIKQKRLSSDSIPYLGELPSQNPPRERYLSEDELRRLFDAAAEMRPGACLTRAEMFMHLALHTSARRTAIQDLEWSQVDWDLGANGVIHYLKPGEHQTRKRKASVAISATLAPILQRMFEEREDIYVISRGARINTPLAAVGERAGVAGVTPHVFRHTAATRMAKAGVPLETIARVLGDTIEVVQKVYAKYQPEWAQSAVDAIYVDTSLPGEAA